MTLMFCFSKAADWAKCSWHAGYFTAVYENWYGYDTLEDKRYVKDVLERSHIIIKLDSVIGNLQHNRKMPDFKRWTLIDHSQARHKLFGDQTPSGKVHIKGDSAFLCFTDSTSVNVALVKLWDIRDVTFRPSNKAGTWMFSLHIGAYEHKDQARNYPDTVWVTQRPDAGLLWLTIERDVWASHMFHQHETDGYYHRYTGLYSTHKNVQRAQELFEQEYGLKTTITSQYISPKILGRYVLH
jgi:hypothetical protein